LILFTIEGEIGRVATQRNAVKGRATLAVPHPISWEAVVRLARRGAGQRKDVGRERLLRSPGGSVAVEGFDIAGGRSGRDPVLAGTAKRLEGGQASARR
jgi:hypothetical protein